MIRLVLAVALATALVATSAPAIDDTRRDHAETTLRAEIGAVERAVADLLSRDDPNAGPGARRVVTLTIPARSWTMAGVEAVAVAPGSPGEVGRIEWSVEGRPRGTVTIEGVPIRTPDSEPVVLRGSGRRRLVLALAGTPAEPVVGIRRFNPEEGGSGVHDRVDR